jgi:GntR family transcriptional repressor for pyruvate dehydrogenase complex
MTRLLKPATRAGLTHQVVDQLVSAIAVGDYPPESALPSEAQLAEAFGVSRLTVREAVKTLQVKGLVRVEQGRGTFVNPASKWSPLDPKLLAARSANAEAGDLSKKILETRRLVETGVAELAASRRSRPHLEALERALDHMRAAQKTGETEEFVEADIAFHQALMDAAGNVFVAALFEPVKELVLEGRRETSAIPEARDHAIDAHQHVLDAVQAGDPAAARRAMEEHLRQTESDLDKDRSKRQARARRGTP